MATLRICTLNVNVLRAPQKKNHLNFFYNEKIDIIFLQETHYESAIDQQWEKEWKGISQWAGRSKFSARVGIIYNEKHQIKISKQLLDPDGRFIVTNCTVETKDYTLVCVYWPDNPTDRLKHVSALKARLETFPCTGEFIIGGDFNCVKSEKNDKMGGIEARHHTRAAEILSPYLKSRHLRDIFLDDKTKKFGGKYTWYNPQKTITSRIDRLYMQPTLTSQVQSLYVEPVFFSDHRAVIANIQNKNETKQGKGYWKMNTSVLNDREYRDQIEGFWFCWKKNKITKELDQWWDIGKKQIKDITIAHCAKRSIQRKSKIRDLNSKLCSLTKTNDPITFRKLESELENLNNSDAFGTQVRTGQRLIKELEIPNEYFYRLEKQKKPRKL